MNITEISEMSNLELNTLLNALIEEKARRKENQKIELWNELCAICTKIKEEGFDIEYDYDSFEIDRIDIC